ncbi:MAG TPA: DUF3108 domain-containing protein [Thiobacillus sp.]
MGRNLRPWWMAVVVSLLLHVSLLGGYWWALPQGTSSPGFAPFEARLVMLDPVEMTPDEIAPVKTVPTPPPASFKPPASKLPIPAPAAEHAPEPIPEPPPPLALAVSPVLKESGEGASPESAGTPVASVLAEPVGGVQPEPVAQPVWPPLNTLPLRVDMRFKVRYGIASGEQTLVWVNEADKHYTIISVAEATGLAGLFYRGKFVQTSRGRMTPLGLLPEEFWDQRGDKRSSAFFDVEQRQLTLMPDKGAPRHFGYQQDAQDVLSLFFQLALTAPPKQEALSYTVFNGKKLRDYRYTVVGEVRLETAVGPLRTLHLARAADSDGRFEVWLAIDRHYLPVRIVKSDEKNNEVELTLLSMAP